MNQPEALRLLGDIYQYGLGLEKDPSTARHFYTQAAKYGDIPSQQKLLLAAELNHSDCIFATNTSSLSVTAIAAEIQRPERVIGFHFFNPAPLMKLTEIVKTNFTSPAVLEQTISLARQMGKLALCSRPGTTAEKASNSPPSVPPMARA